MDVLQTKRSSRGMKDQKKRRWKFSIFRRMKESFLEQWDHRVTRSTHHAYIHHTSGVYVTPLPSHPVSPVACYRRNGRLVSLWGALPKERSVGSCWASGRDGRGRCDVSCRSTVSPAQRNDLKPHIVVYLTRFSSRGEHPYLPWAAMDVYDPS